MDPDRFGPVTAPNRDAVLQYGLHRAVADGWRVESIGPGYAVLICGEKSPDVVHLVLTFFTCGLWLPVWAIMAIVGGERRAMLTVNGNRAVLSKMSRSR